MAATIWKGHLTFGLVSIPIKLFRAARAEKIHMHRLTRSTGTRVRQVFVPADARESAPDHDAQSPAPALKAGPSLVASRREVSVSPPPLPSPPPLSSPATASHAVAPADMVKGYEFEKDKYVTFEPEELENLAPKASADMQIVEFVHLDEVDPVYLESSYYVAADKGGEKPYALLAEALKKTGYAAVAEFVMHRRDQVVILRATQGGTVMAHTLFYEDEVKRENAFQPNPELVSGKELDLAVKLVEALAAEFDPARFKDKFRERLNEAIAAKVATGAVTATAAAAPSKAKPVVDIMAALRESLQATRKPAERESAPRTAKAAGTAPSKKARAMGNQSR